MRTINDFEEEIKFEIYWDYREELTKKQIEYILFGKIEEVESEIWEYNYEYMSDQEREWLKENLTEEELENEELVEQLRERFCWDTNLEGLIKNSSVKIRIVFNTKSDCIYCEDKDNEELNIFKNKFKINEEDWKKEWDNLTCDYFNVVAYFEVVGKDILNFAEEIKNERINLRKDTPIGFFASWVGSGSVLECKLGDNFTIDLRDWTGRVKNYKDEEDGKRLEAEIIIDENRGYSIQETYGLSEWFKY